MFETLPYGLRVCGSGSVRRSYFLNVGVSVSLADSPSPEGKDPFNRLHPQPGLPLGATRDGLVSRRAEARGLATTRSRACSGGRLAIPIRLARGVVRGHGPAVSRDLGPPRPRAAPHTHTHARAGARRCPEVTPPPATAEAAGAADQRVRTEDSSWCVAQFCLGPAPTPC